MNTLDEINIVFAPDDNYVDYCCIAIKSIEENYIGKNKINIYILCSELLEKNKKKIKSTVEQNNAFQIHFREIENSEIIEKFRIKDHFTTAMYYRILIPNLLSEQINKAIYLDCDVLVRKNIKELWDIEIDNYALGAVSTLDFNNCGKLGIDLNYGYFNSGVLIFNLKKWREKNYVSIIMDYLINNSTQLSLPDQDALNFVLFQDWIEVPLKWNVRTTLYNFKELQNDFKQYLYDPAIVHFTTYSKPWHLFNNHIFKEEYNNVAKKSGYSLIISDEIKNILSKNIVIFGAGSSGDKTMKFLKAFQLDLKCFSDNDKSKWNDKLKGIEVINPLELIETKDENVVIISSIYEQEIKEQLLSYGLFENQHFYCEKNLFLICYNYKII
ncbi:glycosyltransferase [Psychrobacillus sp.]|uniref:glycosyltransferase n=1 Tax=Psychrobacillus sp. TaxID=1871623 RepID=UPI0028BD7C7B|nr:glycosyltransferase [Psychrobacillus sp.]